MYRLTSLINCYKFSPIYDFNIKAQLHLQHSITSEHYDTELGELNLQQDATYLIIPTCY